MTLGSRPKPIIVIKPKVRKQHWERLVSSLESELSCSAMKGPPLPVCTMHGS
jgi:hypothetical protein